MCVGVHKWYRIGKKKMSGRRVAAACDRRQLPRGMGSMASPLLDPRPLRLPFLEADVSRTFRRGGRALGAGLACRGLSGPAAGGACGRVAQVRGGLQRRAVVSALAVSQPAHVPVFGIVVSQRKQRFGALRPGHKSARLPASRQQSSSCCEPDSWASPGPAACVPP